LALHPRHKVVGAAADPAAPVPTPLASTVAKSKKKYVKVDDILQSIGMTA